MASGTGRVGLAASGREEVGEVVCDPAEEGLDRLGLPVGFLATRQDSAASLGAVRPGGLRIDSLAVAASVERK